MYIDQECAAPFDEALLLYASAHLAHIEALARLVFNARTRRRERGQRVMGLQGISPCV